MVVLLFAFFRVPDPEEAFEPIVPKAREEDKLTRTFWLYVAFTFVTTLGFASWALLGFHFKAKGILSDAEIPLFYAIAMGVDGAASLVVGLGYDRIKKRTRREKRRPRPPRRHTPALRRSFPSSASRRPRASPSPPPPSGAS